MKKISLILVLFLLTTSCSHVKKNNRDIANTNTKVLQITFSYEDYPDHIIDFDDLSNYDFMLNYAAANGHTDKVNAFYGDKFQLMQELRKMKKLVLKAIDEGNGIWRITNELTKTKRFKNIDSDMKTQDLMHQIFYSQPLVSEGKQYQTIMHYIINSENVNFNKVISYLSENLSYILFDNYDSYLDENLQRQLNYPIMINNKGHKATLAFNVVPEVDLDQEASRYQIMFQKHIYSEAQYQTIEISNLTENIKDEGFLYMVKDPVQLYKSIFGEDYKSLQNIAKNPKEYAKLIKCFKGDGHTVTPDNLHGFISADNFNKCKPTT